MIDALAVRNLGRPTPGPWRIYGPEYDTLGGRSLTILAGKGKTRFGVAQIRIIDPNDALEASANARLIVAAPEMYTLLDRLNRRGGLGLDVHDEIEAQLAKVRGEQ